MSVAKVIEVSACSNQSFDDAIQKGISKVSETVKNVQGAWIKEQKVDIKDGQVVGYRVNMSITFLVD